jgi:hypothetical protein
MSTRIFLGGEGWLACKADNLTAICDPIVEIMWDPILPTTVRPPRPVTVIALFYFLCCKRDYGTIKWQTQGQAFNPHPKKKRGWKGQMFFPQDVYMKEYYGL